jgi:hypothetical protein
MREDRQKSSMGGLKKTRHTKEGWVNSKERKESF